MVITAGKRILTCGLVAMVLALSLALVGCGGLSGNNSQNSANAVLVGTWELSGIVASGVEMPQDAVDEYIASLGEDKVNIIFAADDTVEVNGFGITGDNTAKYTFADGKGTIGDELTTLDFTLEDGKISLEVSGSALIFSKAA